MAAKAKSISSIAGIVFCMIYAGTFIFIEASIAIHSGKAALTWERVPLDLKQTLTVMTALMIMPFVNVGFFAFALPVLLFEAVLTWVSYRRLGKFYFSIVLVLVFGVWEILGGYCAEHLS